MKAEDAHSLIRKDDHLQDSELKDIELVGAEMAGAAGNILHGYFGERLKVSFKDKGRHDPVTDADKASQEYLKEAIAKRFPEHGIVGEEDSEVKESPAPDYLWVLDPLDGTHNFINGMPIYAVSVGVMYRGEPVVGCLFIPWPGKERGLILHARKGGGTYMGEEEISLEKDGDGPTWNKLSGLPAYWGFHMGFRKEMRKRIGEVRTTGSIAHEMAMVSQGVMQYAVHTRPHLWDVAGGVPILTEAGGRVMVRWEKSKEWEALESFFPQWKAGETTLKDVRDWTVPAMVSGPEGVAEVVASSLKSGGRLTNMVKAALRL